MRRLWPRLICWLVGHYYPWISRMMNGHERRMVGHVCARCGHDMLA